MAVHSSFDSQAFRAALGTFTTGVTITTTQAEDGSPIGITANKLQLGFAQPAEGALEPGQERPQLAGLYRGPALERARTVHRPGNPDHAELKLA